MIRVWTQPLAPLFDFEPQNGDILIWFNTQLKLEYVFNLTQGSWVQWLPNVALKDHIG